MLTISQEFTKVVLFIFILSTFFFIHSKKEKKNKFTNDDVINEIVINEK